jgi:hypothetical protein
MMLVGVVADQKMVPGHGAGVAERIGVRPAHLVLGARVRRDVGDGPGVERPFVAID